MPEFELPEFTRSLRALAIPLEEPVDHDRVLAPLMTARTTANRVRGVEGQVAAFDAARLEREWRAVIAVLASERHSKSAPDRRALEAELDTLATPLWKALARLSERGAALRAAAAEARREPWGAWVLTVQDVFDAADDWWRLSAPLLRTADAAPRRGLFGARGRKR